MANIRKLSTFRQLSVRCESPTIDRRRTLRKQFSEDISDMKEKILENKINAKTRDRPPHPIKIAWADTNPESPKQEGVIVKKCIKEVKKTPKLTRHSSLEKDSILYSKQELAERLRKALKEREQEKPNLNIFLAHNTSINNDDDFEGPDQETVVKRPPKLIPPLLTPMENTMKNVFQIRKNKEITCNSPKSSAVVVIPIVEKDDTKFMDEEIRPSPPSTDRSSISKPEAKAIKNVIIRPATAASKRERFQKRNNTAFNSIIKEDGVSRPPLVRSSSAPTKPDQTKPKFLATKRKIKSGKRRDNKTSEDEESISNKENPMSKKEMNRYVPVNSTDIITMVSLISPAASDNEETEVEKPKIKTSPSKPSLGKKEEKDGGNKNLSLRKTVKSVSFQQSSIHAIRSFSASFPGRRGSMATALMLGNNIKNQKNQEKRATNSTVPDDDERGPKRRLVNSASNKLQTSCEDDTAELHETLKIESTESRNNSKILVNITTKKFEETENDEEVTPPERATSSNETNSNSPDTEKVECGKEDEPQFGSDKEKECWNMYCKMSDKGLKVSYDTILRGMLTPTEYRMRRKESIANPAVEDTNKEP